MSCEDELSQVRARIGFSRTKLSAEQSRITVLRGAIAALQAQQGGASSSASATGSTGPATRPTTQPQEEKRGVGDGDMAQYATLSRDIADMERRLDKLETK